MIFPLHDETTVPENVRNVLAVTKKNFGLIPNLNKVMASAPPLLEGYVALWDLFNTTTLSREATFRCGAKWGRAICRDEIRREASTSVKWRFDTLLVFQPIIGRGKPCLY